MKRKVIQLAEKTLVVSLPASWTSKYNVRKGDEVDVEEEGSRLAVRSGNNVSGERAVLDIGGLKEKLVWRYAFAAYIKGSDEIEFVYGSHDEAAVLSDIMRALIGFAIVNEGSASCVARDLSGASRGEFENILRRAFLLLLSVAEDGLNAAVAKDKNILIELKKRDHEINSFTAYCLRYLNKRGYDDYKKTTTMYSVIRELEFLGDEYSDLFRDVAEKGIDMGKNVVSLFRQVNEMLRLFYTLFYKFDKEKIMELMKKKIELESELDMAKEDGDEKIVLNYLSRITSMIFNLAEAQLVAAL